MSHRALAAAVLRQAVEEAAGLIDRRDYATHGRLGTNPAKKARIQAEAYAWLTTESASLEFWCRAAGIEMDVVIDGVHGAIRAVRRGARAPGGGRKRK